MTTLQSTTFDKVILGNKYLDRCGNEVLINRHEEGLNFNRFIGVNGRIYTADGKCTAGVSFDLINCLNEELKEQFDKDVIGKDSFGNNINSLGQTFANYVDYVAMAEQLDQDLEESNKFPLKTCKGLWFPITELTNKYHPKLMIASPKLIDGDSNPEGVSSGYYQDDEGWVVIGWDMNNDEPTKIILAEEDVTHFMYCEGPYEKDEHSTAKYTGSGIRYAMDGGS